MIHTSSISYFLGANSREGFFSLYHEFCNAPEDCLYIIKGGPGTGKSTLMRRLGEAAESRGYPVEYILCSGDPNSLDGIYIPALHLGWADGTAPHVLEPTYFGVQASYIDLGKFCRIDRLHDQKPIILRLTDAYRAEYQKAYGCLAAAGTLRQFSRTLTDATSEARLRKRANAKINKELSHKPDIAGQPTKRFLRAISCEGSYIIADTLNSLCSKLCVLSSTCGMEQIFFDEICKELTRQALPHTVCCDPLCPEIIEAVLIPSVQIGFVSEHLSHSFSGKSRVLHLDSYAPTLNKAEQKHREKMVSRLLERAHDHLAKAKQLHDELEQCYHPSLDIHSLNLYTDSVIQSIFP